MIVHVGDLTVAEVAAMPVALRSAVLTALGYRVVDGVWRPVCQCARHQRRVFS